MDRLGRGQGSDLCGAEAPHVNHHEGTLPLEDGVHQGSSGPLGFRRRAPGGGQ